MWSSVYLPLLLVPLVACFSSTVRRRRLIDVHAAICGLLTAVGLSEGATQLLKLYVHRRRPNYYALCGWNAELLKCTGTIENVRDASFSFPSGHSSLTNCAMTYLVCFMLSKMIASGKPRWMAFSSVVLPWSWAAFVAASRLVDHWHHPSDILAGLLLGGLSATVSFHVWYPPVWSSRVGLPWSLPAETTKLPSFSD
jgi:diacylglycerol diphosphate phosphatase/phosphatidate phosphatase